MRPWLLAGMTFALCLSLYLLTRTAVHTYDALSYILDVDRKPWQELFHPHHLAYGALGALIKSAARARGWADSAERLFQGANALAGAAGVALFGTLVRRAVEVPPAQSATASWQQRTSSVLAGATGALLLAANYAYWYYAVEVEVYTIAALFLVVCLGLLLTLARAPSPRLAATLGLAQGCAVLFHQTNVLLCIPALVAFAMPLADEGRTALDKRLLRLLVAYALPLALIVGGSYLWVGLGVSGFRSWGELTTWMAGYATTGFWGGAVDGGKVVRLGQGLTASLAQPGGALVGLALLAILLVSWRGLRTAPRGAVAISFSWLLVYGAFFLWWEPDNIEFWIASMPPFYLLLVLAVFGTQTRFVAALPSLAVPHTAGAISRKAAKPQSRKAPLGWDTPNGHVESANAETLAQGRKAWRPALLVVCALTMLATNYVAITRRGNAALDLQRVTARELAAQSTPGDLLVLPDGLPELYLPFYEDRNNVTSLSRAMAGAHGDWPAACELLRSRIDGALSGGYAVLIGAEALRPTPAPQGEPRTPAERFGLSPDEVASCYAPYQLALNQLPMGAFSPAYFALPGTQALADGPGWDFARSHWGWQVVSAAAAPSTLPGWALRPEADPALSSPPVRIDTVHYRAVEVRMAATTLAREAQLFFLDEQGRLDETHSVRWTLAAGPAPQTYLLDLSNAPGWHGVVTGLRLDPVSVGDGGTVVVQSLRLVK